MTARKTLAHFGPGRGGVRVLLDPSTGFVRAEWYEHGARRVKSWPDTAAGRAEAKAWARGFAETRTLGPFPSPEPLTLRALWERYAEAEFGHLRPKTQQLYRDAWRKWELFVGRDSGAQRVRLEHVDRLRTALTCQGLAVEHQRRIVRVIKGVYHWAAARELLERNRLEAYRFKVAKEARTEPPPEYTSDERAALLGALSGERADQWRAWAVIRLAAYQGARLGAILHLAHEDVDLAAGVVLWQARWDKTGHTRRQPLTDGARQAVETALSWAARDGYDGPWLFYSSHARKRRLGADERAVYRATSLLRALALAERRAGVRHVPYRGLHGLRRAVAGDVRQATGDPLLGLQYIGDRDLRRAREYLQEQPEELREAAAGVDERLGATRNRHQTVTDWAEAQGSGAELVGVSEGGELPRQDSNLRPAG